MTKEMIEAAVQAYLAAGAPSAAPAAPAAAAAPAAPADDDAAHAPEATPTGEEGAGVVIPDTCGVVPEATPMQQPPTTPTRTFVTTTDIPAGIPKTPRTDAACVRYYAAVDAMMKTSATKSRTWKTKQEVDEIIAALTKWHWKPDGQDRNEDAKKSKQQEVRTEYGSKVCDDMRDAIILNFL